VTMTVAANPFTLTSDRSANLKSVMKPIEVPITRPGACLYSVQLSAV
jgi:hypothetical protein